MYGKGVPQDHVEAARWYRKAAEQGLASAQYSLAVIFHSGRGLEEDVAEAVVQGMAEENFLIFPHEIVHEYLRRKASDRDRWLRGMARVRESHFSEQN